MTPLMNAWQAERIAVVGASEQSAKRGHQIVRALQASAYAGAIYPIHPKAGTVRGLPAFARMADLPAVPDLAVICTPLATVPDLLVECAAHGTRVVVVVATAQPHERHLEQEVRRVAQEQGVRLVGTNTSGLLNPHAGINLAGMPTPAAGGLALVSQSGNVALSIMMQTALYADTGLSGYIGVGNQTDLGFADYLDLFRDDPATRAAMLYVEGVGDGQRFLQEVSRFTQTKPLVVLKAGKSQQAVAAVQSHTGSLAGNYRISADLLRTVGAYVVDQPEQLLPVAEVLSHQQVSPRGHWQVVTDGGGHGSVVADLMVDYGVDFAQSQTANPYDLAGAADDNPRVFADCIDDYLNRFDVDGVLVTGLFGGYHRRFDASLLDAEHAAAHAIVETMRTTGKPVIVHSLYPAADNQVLQALCSEGIAVVQSLDLAVRLMQALTWRARYLNRHPASMATAMRKRMTHEGVWLTEWEARHRLGQADLLSSREQALMTHPDQAAGICHALGQASMALKIMSPDIVHKSDVGGVMLNIAGEASLREAYEQLLHRVSATCPDADLQGVLVTPMAKAGTELVVGFLNDAQYGSVLMLGIGGTWVELLADVAFRALPVQESDVRDMIEQLDYKALVQGYRQSRPNDLDSLSHWVVRVAEWYLKQDDILEMEFNPVLINPDGFAPVDVRIKAHQNTDRDAPQSNWNRTAP